MGILTISYASYQFIASWFQIYPLTSSASAFLLCSKHNIEPVEGARETLQKKGLLFYRPGALRWLFLALAVGSGTSSGAVLQPCSPCMYSLLELVVLVLVLQDLPGDLQTQTRWASGPTPFCQWAGSSTSGFLCLLACQSWPPALSGVSCLPVVQLCLGSPADFAIHCATVLPSLVRLEYQL